MLAIRDADPAADAAACAAVYAPFVRDTAISFEQDAPGAAEFGRRIAAAHVWLVAELDAAFAGYAYAGRHAERAAYRRSADVSVYLAPAARRRGVGRALYEAVLERLRAGGFRSVYAGVTLPNAASVALHRAVGFEPVGTFRNAGWKFDAWHDVAWFQLDLGDPGGTA